MLTVRMDVLTERMGVVETKVDALTADVGGLAARLGTFQAETMAEFAAIRAEMRGSDDETRSYMRVLHEEVLERIRTPGESRF